MKDISSYLDKFRKIKGPRADKETVTRVIKLVTGFDIDPKEITFQKNTIFIKTNPYLRTAIFSHKDQVLENLAKEKLSVMVYDIR